MLEKPSVADEEIAACLGAEYGIPVAQIEFLPLGADVNTAVYRVEEDDGTLYFLKLRRGPFSEASVRVPHFLSRQGVRQVIDPLQTRAGELWAVLGGGRVILYPFVSGANGFQQTLTDRQWEEFGAALRQVHSIELPADLRQTIPEEDYSGQWRDQVRTFMLQVENTHYTDPVASRLAAFMREQRSLIQHCVARAEQLAVELQSQPGELVLCHSDIHAGNILLAEAGDLYLVDWDQPTLALPERDLMFIGGGVGNIWNTPREEQLFYQGYGPLKLNRQALAYYRYERIVQDIAAFASELLLSIEGGADREQSYGYFVASFGPGSVVEIARQTDPK